MTEDRSSYDPWAPPAARTATPTPNVPDPVPAAHVYDTGLPTDPDDTTLVHLRGLARDRGLPTYGTKAEILARLHTADSEDR